MSALAAVAATATAFNLVCTGIVTGDGTTGQSSDPYSVTYRVDLDHQKWCQGDCGVIFDISATQPAFLILEDETKDTRRNYSQRLISIDRRTGEHKVSRVFRENGGMSYILDYKGTCELLPFTGFDDTKVKF